jgi:NADPH:quinone reductase-like Zn-dependent oxidoreductase
MRAAQYNKYGDPDVLHVADAKKPKLTKHRVLVRVHGTSVNPVEVEVRKGGLRVITGPRFPKGIGMDFAGEIVEVGSKVKNYKPGDRVWGFTGGLPMARTLAAAEYLRVKAKWLAVAPESLDLVAAGSLPMVGATSILALRDQMKLRPGERLLVRGASGGVGSIAVQLGKALGAHVTGLAGAANLDFVRGLGADEVFDYKTTSSSDLGTFDVIFDTNGTELRSFHAQLNSGGRMTSTSSKGAGFMIASLVYGRRRVQTFTTPPRSRYFRYLTELVEAGKIVPVIDKVYALSEIADAHRSLERGGGRGKRNISVIS